MQIQTNTINVTNSDKIVSVNNFQFDRHSLLVQVSEYLKNEWTDQGECLADIGSVQYVESELLCVMPDEPEVENVFQVLHFFKADVVNMGDWIWELGEEASNEMWIMVSGDSIWFSDNQEDVVLSMVEDEMFNDVQLVEVTAIATHPISYEEFWNRLD